MALEVRWTKIALADLNSAFEFISRESPPAARKVVKKILDSLEQLKAFPESGKDGRVPETRDLFVSTTPYFIVYKFKGNHLEILNVLHSSKKWP